MYQLQWCPAGAPAPLHNATSTSMLQTYLQNMNTQPEGDQATQKSVRLLSSPAQIPVTRSVVLSVAVSAGGARNPAVAKEGATIHAAPLSQGGQQGDIFRRCQAPLPVPASEI